MAESNTQEEVAAPEVRQEAASPSAPDREQGAHTVGADSEGGSGLDLVLDVPVRLTVEIGGTQLTVREVLALDKGSVVELDRLSGEPADILVNGRLIGRGEVTVVEDRLAVRIVEFTGMERVPAKRA